MLAKLKLTLRSTLVYSFGSIGIKLIGLILLPIYTDILTTDQYGMWSILEITSQIFVISFGLRLSTAMIRFYSSESGQKGRAKIVFTTFWASFLSIIIFNIFTHPFTKSFSIWFFDTQIFAQYFTILILWSSLEIFNRLVLDLLRIKEKPGFYIAVTIIKFTAVLLLIIYFIVFRGMGITGIILGQLIGSLLVFIITLPFLLNEMTLVFDLRIFKKMFSYSFPLIFSGIAAFVLSVGDRYLVKFFLDYHEVGIYSISYKISSVVKMVFVQAFQLGFLPIAFNMYNKPDAKRFFSKIFTYYVFIIFWSGLALSMFAKEIVFTFSSSDTYYEAFLYIPWITLAICFYGIQNFFLIGMHYAKKTTRIAVVILFALVVNIISNIVLIPRLGLYGAAISNIIAGLVMMLLNYLQSQKYYTIAYELRKVVTIVALSISIFLLSSLINEWTILLRVLLKILLILVFPFLLYLFKFYELIEINRIMGIWRKWRNPKYWYRNFVDIALKQSVDSSDA